jgi:hypothetical protein
MSTLVRWDGDRSYPGAVAAVRQALAEETVNAARQDQPSVSVMTMHKSKARKSTRRSSSKAGTKVP